jgi:hypothetical protein
MNTYRWTFLSVRYHKLHARTTSTVIQTAHCHWQCPQNLRILLLTVLKFIFLSCLTAVSGLIDLITAVIYGPGNEG